MYALRSSPAYQCALRSFGACGGFGIPLVLLRFATIILDRYIIT
jgi:hypothetical protein